MKKISKYIFILAVFAAISSFVFSQDAQTAALPTKTYFLSPFKMIPFVSQKQSRKNICDLKIDGPIETVCGKRYNNVRTVNTAKMDELFVILRDVNDSSEPTEMAKYLTTQLIFSTLPKGTRLSEKSGKSGQTSVLVADAGDRGNDQPPLSGISRAEYERHLEDELYKVRSNCPKPGDENWVLTAMCSEYKWIGNVEQPIYSKQYAEYGGPCASEAAQIERTNIQSRVNTKMSSEYNFTDEAGVSSQIACSFSCASYKCPRYEEREAQRTQCKNPIYYPHFDKKWSGELSLREKRQAYENAKSECKDRSYDYVKRPDGTSSLKKVRNCKLSGSGSGELYQDPPDYRSVYVETYCCSCDRIERDAYVSKYNFNDFSYRGGDLLKKLMDAVTQRIIDAPTQMAPPETPSVIIPVQDITPPAAPPVQDAMPAVNLPAPSSVPQVAPPPTVSPPISPPPPPGVTLQFRFTCDVKKELSDGPSYARLNFFNLAAKTELIGDAGGLQNVKALDSLGATNACYNLTEPVPQCIDPRTNTPTDSALDFTKEFTNVTQSDVVQVNYEVYSWLYEMIRGKRQCKADEIPPL